MRWQRGERSTVEEVDGQTVNRETERDRDIERESDREVRWSCRGGKAGGIDGCGHKVTLFSLERSVTDTHTFICVFWSLAVPGLGLTHTHTTFTPTPG